MRNNIIGIQEQKSSDMPSHTSDNYLGEYIVLPTGGKFYPKDHPLYNRETINLKYITPREENILNNKVLINNGTVFDVLLKSIILDPPCVDPTTILSADKTAILFQARITSYGSLYDPRVVCPNCKATQTIQYNLEQYTTNTPQQIFEEAQKNNITYDEDKQEFFITLDSDFVVGCKLLTSKDLENTSEEEIVTSLYSKIITSINGNYDKEYVRMQYENMRSSYSRSFRKLYKTITPKVLCSKDFECSSCGWIIPDLEVPLTAEFFWSE